MGMGSLCNLTIENYYYFFNLMTYHSLTYVAQILNLVVQNADMARLVEHVYTCVHLIGDDVNHYQLAR